MLISHSMRFCTDVFGFINEDGSSSSDSGDSSDTSEDVVSSFTKKALLVSKQAWDCTSKSEVTKIVISGAQPTGSNRRFMFKFDDKIWYFNSTTLAEFKDTLNVDNVLSKGNTAAQITALNNISGFLGKKIYPIVALSAPSTAEDLPTAKMSLQVKVPSDTLTDTQESPVYELVVEDESTPRIAEISYDATLIGEATVTVRLRNNGTWSNYMTLANAADKEAQAVQFKIVYKVTTTDGTDSAKVNSITVEHTMGKTVVSGGNAELFTVQADYSNDLQTCYVLVKHAPLNDSYIEAYINFMRPPEHRNLIQIGTATGARQELALGVGGLADENIVASSIELYVDAAPFANFSFNTATSTVALTAKKNSVITASYDYNHSKEIWTLMPKEYTEPYNDERGFVMSRYIYTLKDDATTGKTVSNIRLRMVRPSGNASGTFGTATGKTQLFVPKHVPKASTIKFNDSNVDFSYNEDNNILSLVAPKGTALNVSYSWTGEKITVYSFAAGWACA